MARIILVLFLLFCSPMSAWAAIAVGTITNSTSSTTAALTITTAFTQAVATNAVMVVVVSSASGTTDTTVSGVTWNTSETFTSAGANCTHVQTAASVKWRSSIWYLVNPTATTANVVVTWSGTGADRAQGYTIYSLSGVNQSTPVDVCAKALGATTAVSNTIVTTVDNDLIIDNVTSSDGSGTWAVGTGTQRVNRDLNSAGNDEKQLSSTLPLATAGSQAMTWTGVLNLEWVSVAAAFQPASTSACNGGLLLMGVGGC